MSDCEQKLLASVSKLRDLHMPPDIQTEPPRPCEMYIKMTSFHFTDNDGQRTYIRAPATDRPDTCTDPAGSVFHGNDYWDS